MAVKSKNQTPAKKQPVAQKAALKKKDVNPDDDDMLDSEEEDDEMMELEDDESIAPDDDDSDEEMEVQPPKSAKKTKLAKGKSPAKELKAKGAEAKEKKVTKSSKSEGPTMPTGKQTNGTKKSSNLVLKPKESRTERLDRTVCVKHLKPNSTDEDIVQFFASVGKCTVVKRVRSKALAMVLLDSAKQIEKAIGLNGKSLNEHPVVVERSKFLDTEDVLKEKKKLRTKKRKLERRLMAKQQAAGTDENEPTTKANGKGKKGAAVDKKKSTTATNGKGQKKRKASKKGATGVGKKEPTIETNGKVQKKNKTNQKEEGSKSKKLGKGKDVANSTAIAPTGKPAKPVSEAKGTKKKETKSNKSPQKVTK